MTRSPTTEPAPTHAKTRASDIMTTSVRTCSPFSTVTEASLIFKDEDCGMVPIVDAGKPVGVVTDRDIALAVASYPDLATRPISDIMSKDPVAVTPDTPLDEVARVFMAHGIRRVLVVDPQEMLMGVIAWSDIAPFLAPRQMGQVVTDIVEQPPGDVAPTL
jgi:CBS domain-containing protein